MASEMTEKARALDLAIAETQPTTFHDGGFQIIAGRVCQRLLYHHSWKALCIQFIGAHKNVFLS